jgi:hypothetical protein
MSTFMAPALDTLSTRFSDITPSENSLVSLDERMINLFAQNAVNTQQEKEAILSQLERPQSVTDPVMLFQLQQRTSNYNLEVSMISTLSRKAVGAVESLLRS